MEEALDELERRLSPGQLLDQGLRMVRENGGEFGRNLSVQVRNNPLPVLFAGIGVTWLMAASDRPPRRGAGETAQRAGRSVGGAAERMGDAAHSAGSVAADRARGVAGSAVDAAGAVREGAARAASGAGAVMDRMAGGSRATADSLQRAYRRGSSGLDYLRREQPLMLGALAIAAGAAIGALLPATNREDEWLGEQSDEAAERLKREGRRRAGELSERAAETAADAAEAARQAAQPKRSEFRGPETGAAASPGTVPGAE